MSWNWSLWVAAWAVVGCAPAPGTQGDDAGEIRPRWAERFHWEDGGRVLVLHGEDEVRLVHEAPQAGERRIGEGEGIATWSTTHVALMEAFGGLDHWAGASGCQYLHSEEALARLADGRARDFEEDAGAALEQLLWQPPAAVTTFPFHNPFDGLSLPDAVPVLPITEYLESHPLGRAEWMRAFGWLVGESEAADSAFAAVEARYLRLRDEASEHESEWLQVFTGSIDGDAFWAPSGNSFIAQFLADAGVHYAFAAHEAPGSIPVDFEELIALNNQVDTWGLVWHDADSITWEEIAATHPVYAELQPHSGAIFAANTRTCDYFGALVAAPDDLLADLIDLFHGEGGGVGCFEWIETP